MSLSLDEFSPSAPCAPQAALAAAGALLADCQGAARADVPDVSGGGGGTLATSGPASASYSEGYDELFACARAAGAGAAVASSCVAACACGRSNSGGGAGGHAGENYGECTAARAGPGSPACRRASDGPPDLPMFERVFSCEAIAFAEQLLRLTDAAALCPEPSDGGADGAAQAAPFGWGAAEHWLLRGSGSGSHGSWSALGLEHLDEGGAADRCDSGEADDGDGYGYGNGNGHGDRGQEGDGDGPMAMAVDEVAAAIALADRLEGVLAGLAATGRCAGPSTEFPAPCLLSGYDIPPLPPCL